MPKFLEQKLEQEASKKGFTGRRADRYVYGAMNNMGAMHGNKETAKGAAMERKHERDTIPQRRPHIDRGHRNIRNPQKHAEKLRHG